MTKDLLGLDCVAMDCFCTAKCKLGCGNAPVILFTNKLINIFKWI